MAEIPAHKVRGIGNDIYGPARLGLARLVKPALDRAKLAWFLDAGTLLGAYRNGTQIPHDDDFDIAAYVPTFSDDDLPRIRTAIAIGIPEPYQLRLVTSYARKIEIFDPASRKVILPPHYGGADFHAVTVDIQIMTDAPDGIIYLHDRLEHVRVPRESITPLGKISLEGHSFNCPHDVVAFLEAQYGYIGEDAVFDEATRKYFRS